MTRVASIDNVISMKKTELDELEERASVVLNGLADAERDEAEAGWYGFVAREAVRELAETALRVVQLEQLEQPTTPAKRTVGDVIGAIIGFAIVVVVVLVAAGAAVWLVRTLWAAAL